MNVLVVVAVIVVLLVIAAAAFFMTASAWNIYPNSDWKGGAEYLRYNTLNQCIDHVHANPKTHGFVYDASKKRCYPKRYMYDDDRINNVPGMIAYMKKSVRNQ